MCFQDLNAEVGVPALPDDDENEGRSEEAAKSSSTENGGEVNSGEREKVNGENDDGKILVVLRPKVFCFFEKDKFSNERQILGLIRQNLLLFLLHSTQYNWNLGCSN